MLDAIGLGHRSGFLITKLSGGERQLTAVARALIGEPLLVLADEPTGSVDSKTGERILSFLLGEELTRRATVVLVTHDPQVAARTDRRVSMLDGRIVPAESGVSAGRAEVGP
jgi:putative ABC transport system ATP-binding protein